MGKKKETEREEIRIKKYVLHIKPGCGRVAIQE
jgi:hypothetical protein